MMSHGAPRHSPALGVPILRPNNQATTNSRTAMMSPADQACWNNPAVPTGSTTPETRIPPTQARKRKAESQENERLSKRLSLLNLERTGQKLYVPVETPRVPANSPTLSHHDTPSPMPTAKPPKQPRPPLHLDETMQLDDSKHKVYIYNLDDELSSSESEAEDGRLVFLPDIERHLFANRIPQAVRPNSEGELAGMQLVLYNVPSSLTVPEEQDSVRKAIIEARARLREKQRLESGVDIGDAAMIEPASTAETASGPAGSLVTDEFDVMDVDMD